MNSNKYRIVGFDTLNSIREYFNSKFDIPRCQTLECKHGTTLKLKWFEIQFVCITDEQRRKIDNSCWKNGGKL